MRKLHVGVIDLVAKAPTKSLWARIMNANFASVMPQAVSAWCEAEGHEVTYICYTGFEDLTEDLPSDVDLVFIAAFSQAAQLAYALSNLFRSKGAVTAIGGPHARCYPQDAQKYFDYVLGFTDKEIIRDVLQDCEQHRPTGVCLAAERQPPTLPSVRERWKYLEHCLEKTPMIQNVPMISSIGCPYTCSFCIDSTVPYQQLSFDTLKDDLRFLLTKFDRPKVAWHDPNFGIRFDECLGAIEEAVPQGSIDFFAETSLALLSEPHLQRLQRNSFQVIMPGIESWYDMGNKSKTGKKDGIEKVKHISEHINMILSYIPYLQANFVVGLDTDEGTEPFELTKHFVDLTPGAYPAYSLLSAFGQAAPLNLEYQKDDRMVAFPFHFLNTQHAMNIIPKNYSWPEFFGLLSDVTQHTFTNRAIFHRYRVIKPLAWRWMNVLRGMTNQGRGRVKYYNKIKGFLETDKKFRAFYEQETNEIPEYFVDWLRRDLGPFWDWLPEGALYHDPHAYLKSQQNGSQPVAVTRAGKESSSDGKLRIKRPEQVQSV